MFTKVSFAASKITGFHGYDIDNCLQLHRYNWQVFVSSQILLEHFSMGKYSPQYIENIVRTHIIHNDVLPYFADGKYKANRKYETKSLLFFACTMLEAGVSVKTYIRVICLFLKHCTIFCKSAVLLALTLFTLLKKRCKFQK